jgi:excisionase family DNA binding protein
MTRELVKGGAASVAEAAAAIPTSRSHVRAMIKRGEIRAFRAGKLFKIPWSELEALVNSQLS